MLHRVVPPLEPGELTFAALDVETANSDPGSICQVGVAHFEDGRLAGQWSTLVDPEEPFDVFNTAIHGIDEYMVTEAPTFRDCAPTLYELLDGRITVHHTAFDVHAIRRAAASADVGLPRCVWLDSARIARRAWPQFARRGYALANVSRFLNYRYEAHDALEDAKAAGNLLVAACHETGLDVAEWLKRVERPVSRPSSIAVVRRRRRGQP